MLTLATNTLPPTLEPRIVFETCAFKKMWYFTLLDAQLKTEKYSMNFYDFEIIQVNILKCYRSVQTNRLHVTAITKLYQVQKYIHIHEFIWHMCIGCIFISGAVHDYQEVHNMPRRHTQVHNFLVNYRFQDLDIPFCYLKTTVIAIDSVFWFSKCKKAILLGECKTKFDQVEIPF